MIYLHIKVHIPNSNSSLVGAIKTKDNRVHTVTVLLSKTIKQKNTSTKVVHFLKISFYIEFHGSIVTGSSFSPTLLVCVSTMLLLQIVDT